MSAQPFVTQETIDHVVDVIVQAVTLYERASKDIGATVSPLGRE